MVNFSFILGGGGNAHDRAKSRKGEAKILSDLPEPRTIVTAIRALIEEYTIARDTLEEAARPKLSFLPQRPIKLRDGASNLDEALLEAIRELGGLKERFAEHGHLRPRKLISRGKDYELFRPYTRQASRAEIIMLAVEKKFSDTVLYELQASMTDGKTIDHEYLLSQFTAQHKETVEACKEAEDTFNKVLRLRDATEEQENSSQCSPEPNVSTRLDLKLATKNDPDPKPLLRRSVFDSDLAPQKGQVQLSSDRIDSVPETCGHGGQGKVLALGSYQGSLGGYQPY
ncbi:hypothetical protein B0I37DRAFT_100153 [Chaetomium sp. MPI-CAGE-AT-0009]|nr:hypothetical protein B0I37DRAFT_100153 [Chaetomium sp. MPI-CAGE-AT-0009]